MVTATSGSREAFGMRAGFTLAAAGSAVGLGNMLRFSYQASEGGAAERRERAVLLQARDHRGVQRLLRWLSVPAAGPQADLHRRPCLRHPAGSCH
jgi:hypothetical protein